MTEWIILTERNLAFHFARHSHHIDFRVFDAALTTNVVNGEHLPERWELYDCGDSWTLDQWEDAFWELGGSVKWDGCINWETNSECMVHGCGPSHAEHVATIFQTIYAYAKRHFDLLGDDAPSMPEPFIEIAIAMETRRAIDAKGGVVAKP